jgi:RNA polymerase sigma-70 factor (ECF subfamily)
LSRCSVRAQQVFHAVYGPGGESHADVARRCGLSVQRVRQILCEVRGRLRRALESREGPWNT